MPNVDLKNGDCLEMMKEIQDDSVDMILTGPPYGTTQCKWDSIIPLDQMWIHLKRLIKPNGAIIIFGTEPFTSSLISSNLKMFRYDLIWQKERGTDFLNANKKPLRSHENISVFYKNQPIYNKQFRKGKPYRAVNGNKNNSVWGNFKSGFCTERDGERNPTTVLSFIRERGFHPTQKPVPLLEYLIRTYTNRGQTVLDFTMGSGSTGVACINTGRNFIGIEKDDNYYKIAKKRIEIALENSKEEQTRFI